METIQTIAQEMCDNFELVKRDDGSEFYRAKEIIDWQSDIVMEAHFDGDRMPNDDIYSRIDTFLSIFSGLDEDATEEDFRTLIYETEADVYTSDLTSWLNADNRNVYYLTEALEEYELKEGFQVLSIAQKLYIEEIGNGLLNGIIKHLETVEV